MEVDLTENVMSRLKVHRALERTAAESPFLARQLSVFDDR
jgi:hypothetical protein